ncbi:hypothetical protein L9F63_022778, partial [Diploptera punctata]
MDKIPTSDTVIVLGDFNAKLGKEESFSSVTGKHTLHEQTNTNGELLCDFATVNNLKVMSTQFQHKEIHKDRDRPWPDTWKEEEEEEEEEEEIHKGTWQSPDNNTINQIDHVLTNGNKHELIEDVRSLRGPNIDSDHFLVKNAAKLKGYCKTLYENLIKLDEKEDVNEEWNSIQQAIKESANVTIMKQEVQPRNEWWDEECKEAIKQKNEARQKKLLMNTRMNQESYKIKRNEANKLCKKKKRTWLNMKLNSIELNYKKNETRKFFKDVKSFQKYKAGSLLCRDNE